jgi:hypothetical protein
MILALAVPVLFCACFSQTVRVDLSRATILPVVAADREAAPNAQPLSLVRPRDRRENPALSNVFEASAFPITVHQTFVAENAAVWAGNGLVDGLENAGYKVERTNSVEAAVTPVVITVDLTKLSSVPISGIKIDGECTIKLAIGVRVIKAGRVLSDSQYESEGKQQGGTCFDADTLNLACRKALEALLTKAVPEIGLTLHAATQPEDVVGPAAHRAAQ